MRTTHGGAETHVPFVTWAIQDTHIVDIEKAINLGTDLLTDKSRDMGATWDHIVAIHHQWLFREDRTFLELSRKEECVDTYGKSGGRGSDPGTLFGKHDYINRWLPKWMLPAMDRTHRHLVNLQNYSRIDGESANASAGSSDRRTAILLDEMAKMAEGESIKRSTRDVTACRLVNSTPNGAGTAYSKWCKSGQIKVFRLMYWNHPEKGRGRHVEENTMYPGLGPWLIRSPWFDNEEKTRSAKELAIDVLADHIGSGDTYFEAANIELHRVAYATSFPVRSYWTIDFRKKVTTTAIPNIIARSHLVQVDARRSLRTGPMRIWPRLIRGRLDQSYNYILGIDISKGQGASNSVISVLCEETKEKVAEWADANTPPYELARIACAIALWIGGARRNGRPLMIWEANGPGWDFGRQVVKLYKYPFYYIDTAVTGTTVAKQGKRYGWHSSTEKKEEALGLLRRAYAHGGIINHSVEALDEALEYVYLPTGIGPASLVEESKEARKCHGDRVIADMLTLWATDGKRLLKRKDVRKPPKHSMMGRRLQRERQRKLAGTLHQNRFDFRDGRGGYQYAN